MRIGLAYNEKPDSAPDAESDGTGDAFAEWDDPSTIKAVEQVEPMALPYPVFVKPVAEGSGKGVFATNLCANVAALRQRARFLLERYAEPVLVETYLPGPEFTVAILGNGPQAYCLPVIGFDFSAL